MGIKVTDLITEAYYDSSVVARQFETLQGYQLTDGLKWLNQILDDKAMDTGDIAYITQQYPLVGVAGQETYFIPNCISIDAIVFYIGSVRYQMNYVDRIRYFQQPRANNINALPVSYTYERVYGGVKLWVYFWPQQPFLFNITGNFFMQNVALNQDLTAQLATVNFGAVYMVGAIANLGVGTVLGSGILGVGEIVINGIDLSGTYTSITAFVDKINTGIVPGVIAEIISNEVILSSGANNNTITTLGTVTADGLTFSSFNTTSGPANLFFALGATLKPGGLVINGVDMFGTYASIGAFITHINAGNIANVIASYDNFQFTLASTLNTNILVETNGVQGPISYVSFEFFSTIGKIPLNQTYLPMALDGFYSDYLELQLCERICFKLNFAMPDGAKEQLSRYRLSIIELSEPMDLTQQKVNCLGDVRAINYAAVNIGRGYTVSGY